MGEYVQGYVARKTLCTELGDMRDSPGCLGSMA